MGHDTPSFIYLAPCGIMRSLARWIAVPRGANGDRRRRPLACMTAPTTPTLEHDCPEMSAHQPHPERDYVAIIRATVGALR